MIYYYFFSFGYPFWESDSFILCTELDQEHKQELTSHLSYPRIYMYIYIYIYTYMYSYIYIYIEGRGWDYRFRFGSWEGSNQIFLKMYALQQHLIFSSYIE
jgi:hypothetical protein